VIDQARMKSRGKLAHPHGLLQIDEPQRPRRHSQPSLKMQKSLFIFGNGLFLHFIASQQQQSYTLA
jgi:hypothetical protein